MAAHPRFEPVVVADDADQPDWVHERNQEFADEYNIPYVRDVERAIADYDVQVAVINSEAERHCDLSVRAANAGLHVVQDKPMSNRVSECDRVVEAVERKRRQVPALEPQPPAGANPSQAGSRERQDRRAVRRPTPISISPKTPDPGKTRTNPRSLPSIGWNVRRRRMRTDPTGAWASTPWEN